MFALKKEFRDFPVGLPDLLNWGAMVDEGVMLNKDGSFTTAFYFRGNDLESSTADEMTALAQYVNAAMVRLGSGWVVNVDTMRVQSRSYPDASRSFFPNATTRLIEEERRAQHQAEGQHFDTVYALALTYQTPPELQNRISAFFVVDNTTTEKGPRRVNYQMLMQRFQETVADVVGSMSAGVQLRKMNSEELLTYLHTCLTSDTHPVKMPGIPMYLDAVLGSKDFAPGTHPRIGRKHIRIVAIRGFPSETFPGIQDRLNRLAFEYRWSTRFIPLDTNEANKRLGVFRRNWWQKRHGMLGLLRSATTGAEQTWTNGDAVRMATDADQAVNDNESGEVKFGYYTTVLVVMSESEQEADDNAKEIEKLLGNSGFPSSIETTNAVEAYIGSLPAHPFQNVRRPIIHTLNLADMLPLTAVWAGHEFNPSPFYPPKSPPLVHAATVGATPFRLSLHVGDLGHFTVLGPPGAGKSTLLCLLMAQHFRYPNAQVFGFDFGYSMAALCEASGGRHYDLAADGASIGFCPLSQIDTQADRAWAANYIGILYELSSGGKLSVDQQNEIQATIERLARDTANESDRSALRTITHFVGSLSDKNMKAALKQFQIGHGVAGDMLDASNDALADAADGRFFVFEMQRLAPLGEKVIVPVLLYLFRQVQKRLRADRPTLAVVDEAFRSFEHPLAQEELKEWLETGRKENMVAGLATQNLGTVLDSPHGLAIMQSTATQFLLANPAASTHMVRPLYEKIGLNAKQISNIAAMVPKRDYYVMNADGKRMFTLGLGKIALAFVGVSGKLEAARIKEFKAKHGDDWVPQWLAAKDVAGDWINYWKKLNRELA